MGKASSTDMNNTSAAAATPPSLRVESAPHLGDSMTTRWIMLDVAIALVPALIAAIIFFRGNAIRVVVVSVATCMVTELIFNLLRRKPNSLGDGSALVTGMILAFSLPPALPSFAVIIGSVVAMAIGKMIFGGLGHNIFNPAMVGRAFLMAAFPTLMTTWTLPATFGAPDPSASQAVDAVSQATPLAILTTMHDAETVANMNFWQLFIGRTGGSLGETSIIALLLGGVYLLFRRTIDISIPFGMLGAVVVFSAIGHAVAPDQFAHPIFHLVSGSVMFGAFFIATDPVSSPLPKSGRWIYGAGVGALTMVIRQFGTYPEGVMFSILLMNALAPLLTRWTTAKPVGGTVRG